MLMIVVFSYNRLEMLKQVVSELKNEDFIVLDDGSEFDIDSLDCDYMRFEHVGKEGFWRTWNLALELCKESNDDFFMFTPDDFINIDLKRIKKLHNQFKSNPYIYNTINDGREQNFIHTPVVQVDKETIDVGFNDCGFFCNRAALEMLEFKMIPIPLTRFNQSGISSGVGQQLTMRLHKAGVPMYKPFKSLAYHGEHESVMHKEERKQNPLISI